MLIDAFAMRNPITITGQAIVATASIGVAYCSARTSEKLLCASANAALYVAKAAGRNTFHIAQIEGQSIAPCPDKRVSRVDREISHLAP